MQACSMALRSARRHSQSALFEIRMPFRNLNGSGSLDLATEFANVGGVPTVHFPLALSSLPAPPEPMGPLPPAPAPPGAPAVPGAPPAPGVPAVPGAPLAPGAPEPPGAPATPPDLPPAPPAPPAPSSLPQAATSTETALAALNRKISRRDP